MTYFSLKNPSGLHLTPDGASVMIHAPTSLNDPSIVLVNKTAREILRLCDGRHTEREILARLIEEFNTGKNSMSEILQDMKEFLEEAANAGIIESHQEQSPNDIKTTGDPEYYFPQHVMIELTKDCNLECVHCYRESGRSRHPRLETGRLLEVLGEFRAIGVQVVELTGGEPLMHPDILELMDFVGQTFDTFSVVSNGGAWSERHVAQVAKYRHKAIVQIDLDGPSAAIHRKIRGTLRAFDQAVRTIKRLKSANVRVRVAMNVIPETLAFVEETLLLAKSLGADWFAFAPVQSLGRAKGLELRYNKDQGRELTRLARILPLKYGSFVSRHSDFVMKNLSDAGNCGAGYRSITLSPEGRLRPCVMFPEDAVILGDVRQQNVRDVLRTNVVNFMHQLHTPGPECPAFCPNISECRGCYARAISAQTRAGHPCVWALQTGFAEFWNPQFGGKEGGTGGS